MEKPWNTPSRSGSPIPSSDDERPEDDAHAAPQQKKTNQQRK